MTTKSEIFVQRVNQQILMVGGVMVVNDNGLWITPTGVSLGGERIKAIFRFLNRESYKVELDSTKAVRKLLHECDILYQIN